MYQKIVLKNGLRVILVPRRETEAVTVMLGVGAGSRDESEDIAGISHFVEHMNFKGTMKRPTAREVSEFIEDRGGMVNAYTSKEHTAYYVKIASEHLLSALDYIADNAQNSLNLQAEFDREKNVILEDIKMHKDRPMEEVEEIFEEAIFTERSLARRVASTVGTVSKITLQDLNSYENKHYHTANYVLAIVGNYSHIEEEILLSKIDRLFKDNRREPADRILSGSVDKKVVVSDRRPIEQTNLVVGFAAPGQEGEQKYAVKLLARVLGGSMSSRMWSEIREKRGLAYAIDTSYSAYREIGALATYAGIANDKLEETLKAITDEYQKIKSSKVGKQELMRAKEITKGLIKISLEDSENLADMIVSAELDLGIVQTPQEIIDKYLKVTEDDLRQAANDVLDFNRIIVSVVGPDVDKNKVNKLLKL